MKLQYRYIFTRKQGAPAIKVSPEDYDSLSEHTWYVAANGYANCKPGKARGFSMHRLIMGLQYGDKRVVDHIDGDKMNNTRGNLRICTNQQNRWNQKRNKKNTSGFKGVSWHKEKQKWEARIRASGCRLHLGYFDTPELAHSAYIEAAKKYFKEFARAA